MYTGLDLAHDDFAVFGVVGGVKGAEEVLWSMEIGVCDACFVISGVVGGVEVVGGVSGAEEVAFAIFRVLEGVQVPATAA